MGQPELLLRATMVIRSWRQNVPLSGDISQKEAQVRLSRLPNRLVSKGLPTRASTTARLAKKSLKRNGCSTPPRAAADSVKKEKFGENVCAAFSTESVTRTSVCSGCRYASIHSTPRRGCPACSCSHSYGSCSILDSSVLIEINVR